MSDYLDLSNINVSTQIFLDDDVFPILKGLSPLNMRILNSASTLLHINQDVETLHKGDYPRGLYFIRKGSVSVHKARQKEDKNIAKLSQGDIFGEFAILRKKAHYASIYTLEDSEIIRVNADAVLQVTEADKAFKQRLQQVLSQRILNSFFFSHPIFQTLSHELRLAFSHKFQVSTVAADTVLFQQGTQPQGLFLILSGTVEIYRKQQQTDRLLEIRRDHDVLGELAANQGKEAAYSAIASSALDLLIVDKEAMMYIRQQHPETFKRLEIYMRKRAEHTQRALLSVGS